MLSFVIPAHNEAEHIAACVASIRQHTPAGEPYEVIVVENRSTDRTAEIAAAAGATVIHSTAATIGAVRNEGVRASRGDTLVLLDGDCLLTEAWGRGIAAVLQEVRATPLALAGSHPVPPADEHVFLWEHWFVPFLQQEDTSHVGSAHMIMRRETFHAVGGFDERLATGEDFDLCVRVRRTGGRILVRLPLRVEHHGYPRTIRAFVRRERWHGRGDASSLRAFLSSRVATLSVAFSVAVVAAAVLLVLGRPAPATGAAMLALALPVLASVARFRHVGARGLLIASALFMVYFAARTLAVVDGVRRAR